MCKVYVSHQLMADIIFSITSWCYFFCLLNAFHTLETIRYNRRTQTETLSTDSFSWLFSLLSLSLLCIWFHLFCGAFQSHFRYAIRSVSAFATHTHTHKSSLTFDFNAHILSMRRMEKKIMCVWYHLIKQQWVVCYCNFCFYLWFQDLLPCLFNDFNHIFLHFQQITARPILK